MSIRSICNFLGYWNNTEATQAAIMPDGFFRSGDLGYLDEDGYLFIVDRKKDIIIRGGENISCQEVEAALYAHPAVAEASVFGLPDERLGEIVGAVVYAKPGAALEPDALLDFVARDLAAMTQRTVDKGGRPMTYTICCATRAGDVEGPGDLNRVARLAGTPLGQVPPQDGQVLTFDAASFAWVPRGGAAALVAPARSPLDLATVLTTIVSRAVELSGLDGGVVFEYDEAVEVAGAITPVPGGVGPVTVATLMKNAVLATRMQMDHYRSAFAAAV